MPEPYDDRHALALALADAVDVPPCPPWCALDTTGHPWDSMLWADDCSPCRTHERTFGGVTVVQMETAAVGGPALDPPVILAPPAASRDLDAAAAARLGRDLIAAAEFALALPAAGSTPAGSR